MSSTLPETQARFEVKSLVTEENKIGALLVESGKLQWEDIEPILRLQREQDLRFGEAALQLGLVLPEDIRFALARQFGYTYLPHSDAGMSEELIAAYKPFSPEVEALRTLRSQLLLRWFDRGQKVLSLVSANVGEGCSAMAANLAVLFSQLGRRTLLIDADLRNPRQHEIFNMPNREGLSDVLAHRVNHSAVMLVNAFSNFYLLTAGTIPPNPQELLTRQDFPALLEDFSDLYDVIIIDTPPSNMNADAQTVLKHTGGALMVMRQDLTRVNDAMSLKATIAATNAEIVGSVLNRF